MRLRNIFRFLLLATITSLTITACETINDELPTYAESSIVAEGDTAPDFNVTLLNGESLSLSSLRGKVVLLVLFSHTCPDCKMLFDDIMTSKALIYSLGVEIVAIPRGGSKSEIEEYITTNGYDFTVGIDEQATIFYDLYATAYVPRSYLIDKQGIIDTLTIEYDSSYVPRLIERMTTLVAE